MTEPLPRREAALRRRLAAALAVTGADADAGWAAYEGALIAGLCHEGAWEVALGAATASPEGRVAASAPHPPNTAPARLPSP